MTDMDIFVVDKSKPGEGFTLLELLIVIGILAILATVVIFVLNPAETLRETRDTQRLSDLSTIKTSLGLYLTSTTTPSLGGSGPAVSDNAACKTSPTAAYVAGDRIFYSASISTASITDADLDGSANVYASQTATANLGNVDGAGWLPTKLTALSNGSPIDTWPVDPTNTVTVGVVANSDLVYRYACAASPLSFELNARLEASKNTDKMSTDGGNNSNLYEIGTDLRILNCSTSGC